MDRMECVKVTLKYRRAWELHELCDNQCAYRGAYDVLGPHERSGKGLARRRTQERKRTSDELSIGK